MLIRYKFDENNDQMWIYLKLYVFFSENLIKMFNEIKKEEITSHNLKNIIV